MYSLTEKGNYSSGKSVVLCTGQALYRVLPLGLSLGEIFNTQSIELVNKGIFPMGFALFM